MSLATNRFPLDSVALEAQPSPPAEPPTAVQRTAELEAANARLQQEIAERQRIEEALRKTVQAVEQSPVSIVVTNLDGRIEYVNPKFTAVTGYSAEEVIGANPRLLKSGETSAADYRRLWETISSGREWRGEFHNRRKNGELYWELASISPIRTQQGVITHYLAVKEDITERKRVEENLRLNEARLEALLRLSAMTAASEKEITEFALEEGVRLTNSAIGYLHFINADQVSLELFTWSKEVHRQCYAEKTKHYPLEQAGVWVDCVRRRQPVIHNDYPQLPERKGYPEGHIHVRRHLSVPVLDAERVVAVAGVGNKAEPYDEADARQLSLFMSAMWGLLQRKRTEVALQRRDELSAANAALARAARLKDEFLASMSHELRTPLTGVLNLTEALQEQLYGPLNERQQKYLQIIEDNGRHLLELINDILDFSRLEAGQLELRPEKCSVGEVCRSSLQLIESMARKKGQQLSFMMQPTAIELKADARRLKQMLFNLLGNAVKFTPEGGKLGLRVEGDPAASMIRFSVWDTGIGIAADDLSKLFQPFTQLDSRLARQYSGAGLGLSLVERMAALHGGGVSVASAPGQGSCFTLYLPWSSQPVAQRSAADSDQRHAIDFVASSRNG